MLGIRFSMRLLIPINIDVHPDGRRMQKTAQSRPMRTRLLVLTAAPESVLREDYTAVLACLQIALLRSNIDHA